MGRLFRAFGYSKEYIFDAYAQCYDSAMHEEEYCYPEILESTQMIEIFDIPDYPYGSDNFEEWISGKIIDLKPGQCIGFEPCNSTALRPIRSKLLQGKRKRKVFFFIGRTLT